MLFLQLDQLPASVFHVPVLLALLVPLVASPCTRTRTRCSCSMPIMHSPRTLARTRTHARILLRIQPRTGPRLCALYLSLYHTFSSHARAHHTHTSPQTARTPPSAETRRKAKIETAFVEIT